MKLEIDKVGVDIIVTVEVLVEKHPFIVPVTVYIVVELGLAVTVVPDVELKPALQL